MAYDYARVCWAGGPMRGKQHYPHKCPHGLRCVAGIQARVAAVRATLLEKPAFEPFAVTVKVTLSDLMVPVCESAGRVHALRAPIDLLALVLQDAREPMSEIVSLILNGDLPRAGDIRRRPPELSAL